MPATRSLSHYLLRAALAATLLPMLVMVNLSYGQYREDLRDLERWAGEESHAQARLAANMLSFLVDDAESALRHARAAIADGADPLRTMASALQEHAQIQSLVLTDAAGRVVASTVAGEAGSLASAPHVRAVASGAPVAFGSVTYSPTLHKAVLPIALPRYERGGYRGALVARLNPEKLSELLLSRLGQDGRAFTYVTDGGGRLIAHPDPDAITAGKLVSDAPPVKAGLAGRDEWMPFSLADGSRRVAGVKPMSRTGWVVVASRDAGDSIGKATGRFFTQMLTIGLITLLAGLFALWGGRWLARPLEAIARAMSQARAAEGTGAGRLAEASVPTRVAEYETLAGSYNALVAELNRRFDALGSAQEELEAQNEELHEQSEAYLQQNRELTRAQAFNQLLLNSAGEGILGTDVDGCITFANPAAARMLGLSVDVLLGQPLRSLVEHGRPGPGIGLAPAGIGLTSVPPGIEACPYHAALRDDALQRQIGTRFKRAGGPSFPSEVSINRIRDAEADLGAVVVFTDITERLAAERAARLEAESRAALAHAEELEARNVDLARLSREAQAANKLKSEFLANMSHELRTPLNSIIGYTEVVLTAREPELAPRTRKHLEVVLRNGRNLLALINDVLDLSKVEAGKTAVHLEPVEPGAVLSAVASTTEPMAIAKGLELSLEVDPALGTVMADETKLRQIVLNLVSNAVKFTKEGGVSVRAEARGGDRWAVVVTDTGIGIDGAHQALIFDAFRQVDASTTRQAGGTGLGLAIARKLARLMHGDVTVESAPGEGSTFTLELPAGIHHPHGQPAEPQPVTVPEGHVVVLAIDDEAEALQLIAEKLAGSPYTVVQARSAEEGLRLARELRPFAITLDVLMPEKDGWSALRELKGDPTTADIPVLILSFMENKLLGFALGASAYLPKPIDQSALLETLAGLAGPEPGGYVLVVDDDADTRALYRQALAARHLRVFEAADGRAAVAAIAHERPMAVLLDLMMPGMDGFEVMAWLRAHPECGQIPVIVLTAKDLGAHDVARLGEARRLLRKGDLSEVLLVNNLREVLERVPERP